MFMKYFKIITILLFTSVISFYACKDNTTAPKQETSNPTEFLNLPSSPNVTEPIPAATEAPQNASGVWHYTCLKGCAGGAGAAVNCSTCGSPLAHNTGYHANTNNTPFATPPPAAAAAEPSQNTVGVWHYTCEKGCAGGAGSAGPCATCGSTLAHNTAYHQ